MMRAAIVCLVVLLAVADAFPNGAPKLACKTLKPLHGLISAQKETSPYTLEVSKKKVNSLSSEDDEDLDLETITGWYT